MICYSVCAAASELHEFPGLFAENRISPVFLLNSLGRDSLETVFLVNSFFMSLQVVPIILFSSASLLSSLVLSDTTVYEP